VGEEDGNRCTGGHLDCGRHPRVLLLELAEGELVHILTKKNQGERTWKPGLRERESAFTSGQVAGVLVGEDSNGRVLEDGLGGRSRLGLEDSEEKVKGENGTKTRRKKK